MFTVLLTVHIVLCLGLILFVLLQQGKGADAGATFGGSNAGSVLGTGGADFATKLTTGMAFAFMVTSVLLVRSYQHLEIEQLAVQESPSVEGTALGSVLEQQASEQVAESDAVNTPIEQIPAVAETEPEEK